MAMKFYSKILRKYFQNLIFRQTFINLKLHWKYIIFLALTVSLLNFSIMESFMSLMLILVQKAVSVTLATRERSVLAKPRCNAHTLYSTPPT